MFDEFMKEQNQDDFDSEMAQEVLTPEEELQQTLDELEQAIYEDSETVSQITSKEEDLYMFTVSDISELTKLWIELKQNQDGDDDGEEDKDDDGGQGARDAAAKARAYMQKRAEKQQERNNTTSGGDQSNEPIGEHGDVHEDDVESSQEADCKALMDLVGPENYKKIAAKIPVNQNTHVIRKPIPTVNHRYEYNGNRRSVVAIPIKLDGKVIRVAYESEIRTVVVGE